MRNEGAALLRFLPGLILVQLVAVALYAVRHRVADDGDLLQAVGLGVLLPAAVVTLVTALWFANLARQLAERRHAELIERHAREREELKVSAVLERERVKGDAARERDEALENVRRQARRDERRANRAASLKVGGAWMAATAIGVLFLFTELLTLGLLTITSAGGALGGYLLRWRQTRGPHTVPIPPAGEPLRELPDPLIRLGAPDPPETPPRTRSADLAE